MFQKRTLLLIVPEKVVCSVLHESILYYLIANIRLQTV